jgi:uncharacterized protein YqeY
MSLEERLYEDMKEALKAREAGKLQLSVIRMARAALKNRSIALGRDLIDDDVIDVLAKEVKMRRDAIPEYESAGNQDMVKQLQEEIAILKNYLPQQLDKNEIVQMAREVIASTGANSERDLGKVMCALMPRLKGRADGKLVNRIVRELLGSQ